MKKLFILISIMFVAMFSLASATTFKTITLDGSLAEWSPDEFMGIDSSYIFYMTWDANSIYFAIDRQTLPGGAYLGDNPGVDDSFFVAIDVNQTPGFGANSDGYGMVTSFLNPFRPEFVFYFAGGGGWYEWSRWTSNLAWQWNGWSNLETYYGWNNPGNYNDEFSIARSAIDYPSAIAVYAWRTKENSSPIIATWPQQNPTGNAGAVGFNWVYWIPTLGPGLAPNVVALAVPVELSRFEATVVPKHK